MKNKIFIVTIARLEPKCEIVTTDYWHKREAYSIKYYAEAFDSFKKAFHYYLGESIKLKTLSGGEQTEVPEIATEKSSIIEYDIEHRTVREKDLPIIGD